jgi:hypothetical protein
MATLYDKVLHNQRRKEQGKVNSIYWSLPRLTSEYDYPGFIKGKYFGVTANSSINT